MVGLLIFNKMRILFKHSTLKTDSHKQH